MEERRVTVDKQSVDYQLGAIITRIDGQNGHLADLTNNIRQLTEKIGDLPCVSHDLRIEAIEKRKAAHKEDNQWEAHNKLTFKQALIAASIAAAIGSAAAASIILFIT